MSKYLPWSRAPSSGRNGPSLHPRNPQAGSAAAKNWQNVKLVRNSNTKLLEHACLSTNLFKALFPLETLTWPKMAKLRESLKTFSLYFFDFAAPEQKQNVLSSYDANLSALENSTRLSFFYTDETGKIVFAKNAETATKLILQKKNTARPNLFTPDKANIRRFVTIITYQRRNCLTMKRA